MASSACSVKQFRPDGYCLNMSDSHEKPAALLPAAPSDHKALDNQVKTNKKVVRDAWARATGTTISLVGAVWLFSLAYLPILDPDLIQTVGDRLLPAFGATILAFCIAIARAFVNFLPSSPSRLWVDIAAGIVALGFGITVGVGSYDLSWGVVIAGSVTYIAVIVQDALMSRK
jgi:hypothetical protein